jgi:adenylylsulfate kinase
MKRVLIMGLPGSGKTTLAQALRDHLEYFGRKVVWLNADRVRQEYNDWDFTLDGRIRQSRRMRDLADKIESDFSIVDFVAPLPEMRTIFAADYTVWMDTVSKSGYDDTNKLFVPPEEFDVRITMRNAELWSAILGKTLLEIR